MGRLRIEPRYNGDPLEMRRYVDAVKEVAVNFWTGICYWNLGKDDDTTTETIRLRNAAKLLGIPMTIRKRRDARQLLLVIRPHELAEIETHQLFVAEYLWGIERPVGKNEILTATGIPPNQWRCVISGLKEKGFVIMHGEKGNRTYCISQEGRDV